MKNMMLFPCQFNCLCWKIAMLLCWIFLCWMWQVPLSLDTEREWPWCSKPCLLTSENDVTLWEFCSRTLSAAIVMALLSLIKTESRTAKLRQVDSHCQGLTGNWTSEWMNLSLVFCSLPRCHFLILSFPRGLLLRKESFSTTWHVVFLCYLSSFKVLGWFLPATVSLSPETDIWKKLRPNSNILYIFLKCFWISLPINAKKNLLQHLFFAKHTYLLELHLELNSGSSLHLYRSLSPFYTRCAPFRAWKCSQARPAALQYYGSPLSAVSSTCKEIMWDKCYGSVRLALFTASLTKKCVVWNCALGKWQCLHNETGVTRSILNSSKKQLLHLKSRRTRPRRHPINAQFLMGTSWRLCQVPQCRKSLLHGGWVCLWVSGC